MCFGSTVCRDKYANLNEIFWRENSCCWFDRSARFRWFFVRFYSDFVFLLVSCERNVLVWIRLWLICCIDCCWLQWVYLGWLFDGCICCFSLLSSGFRYVKCGFYALLNSDLPKKSSFTVLNIFHHFHNSSKMSVMTWSFLQKHL